MQQAKYMSEPAYDNSQQKKHQLETNINHSQYNGPTQTYRVPHQHK